MNSVRRALGMFFMILGLAYSGWYFARTSMDNKLDETTLAKTPDAVFTDLVLTQYDKSGQQLNRLQTPQMRHIPKEDRYFLLSPRIWVAQDNQSPWEIKSDRAIVYHGGNQVRLINHVVIYQAANRKGTGSTIKTDELTYYPKEKQAFTDAKVTFEQPGTSVESQGMRANLAKKQIELLHRARGKYVPSHS